MLRHVSGLYREIFSDEILTEAWHQVKTKSSNAPGIDGVSLSQFQRHLFTKLKALQKELAQRKYRPQPVKHVVIPKSNGDKRPISIFTIRDRIAQRAVLNVIEPLFELDFEDSSYGFRPGRSVEMAVDHVASYINQGYYWIAKLDIERCFENLNLRRLQKCIARHIKDRLLRNLISCWISDEPAQTSSGEGLSRKHISGIPQGSPLSPLLMNVYLDQFDKMMRKRHLCTVRYADDIVMLCRTEEQARSAVNSAKKILKQINLSPNQDKTGILNISHGFSFLGAVFQFQEREDEDGSWVALFPHAESSEEYGDIATPSVATADYDSFLQEAYGR